jgi:hypothetical protein
MIVSVRNAYLNNFSVSLLVFYLRLAFSKSAVE